MKLALLALITLCLSPTSWVPVVPPKRKASKRLLLLVDCSGSMSGLSFSRMREAVRLVAGQPIDEGEFALVAFREKAWRWRHKNKRWVKLPDAKALAAADYWLQGQGATGGTRIIPALYYALTEVRSKLTIVIVSDGIFLEHDADVLRVLASVQQWRKKVRLQPAVVGTVSVAPVGSQHVLAQIGRVGGGGCYAPRRP